MKTRIPFLLLIILALLALSACGGEAAPDTAAADAGEALFAEPLIGVQPGCSTCHSLEPGLVMVGPSLAGVGARAGTTVAGASAEDYLRESILDPDAYVVDGFIKGIMVQIWEDELTGEQVDNLVAYLLTLE